MDRVGFLREDLFWALDYDYWARIMRAGSVVGFVDSELACFRLHPCQKSTQPELTANELLCTVRPYIFADDAPIGWFKRTELRGKWIFDAKFRREADRSLRQKESRYRRWLTLICLSLLHPELLAAPGFRQRLLSIVSSYKPTVSSLNRPKD
jgi:hypothetical protein